MTESIHLGPFALESPIGKGGMGVVWSARHVAQQLPVAVKILTTKNAREQAFVSAFRSEVRAVASLDHPAIVKVYDYGELTKEHEGLSKGRLRAGNPYLVMELASDRSLHHVRGRLPWFMLRKILLSLLDALAHAHARGVIHRDLKPGNVLFHSSSKSVLLMDFGLAHMEEHARLTWAKDRVIGTPTYMAPEQFEARWRDYGPWTDLYALGCLAYTMITGEPPFGRKQPVEQHMKRHLNDPIPPIEQNKKLPKGLEAWLHRLMAKHPTQRYRRAADAAWDLLQLDSPKYPLPEEAPGFSALFLEQEDSQTLHNTPSAFRNRPLWAQEDGAGLPQVFDESDQGTSSSELLTAFRTEAVPFPHSSQEEETPPHHVQLPDANGKKSAQSELSIQKQWLPTASTLPTEVLPLSSQDDTPTQFSAQEDFDEPFTTLLFSLTSSPGKTRNLSGKQEDSTQQPSKEEEPENIQQAHQAQKSVFTVKLPFPDTWEHKSPQQSDKSLQAGLNLYGLRSIPLIARKKERHLLWSALQDVHKQRIPRMLILEGETGSGKSRLIQWLSQRSHELGLAHTLQATHTSQETQYHGLRVMLRRYFRCEGMNYRSSATRIRKHFIEQNFEDPHNTWRTLARWVNPAEAEKQSKKEAILFRNHHEKYALLTQWLSHICQNRALLLWLDDLQWGYEACEFAQHILQNHSDTPLPILLVGTVQSETLSHRHIEQVRLESLRSLDQVQTLQLHSFDTQAYPSLVQELLPLQPALTQKLEQCTKGNPLFTIHLIGSWIQKGLLIPQEEGYQLRENAPRHWPKDLDAFWEQRLEDIFSQCSDAQSISLELAACLGQEINTREWRIVCRFAQQQRELEDSPSSEQEEPTQTGVAGGQLTLGLLEWLFFQGLATPIETGAQSGWAFVHNTLTQKLSQRAKQRNRWKAHHDLCAKMLHHNPRSIHHLTRCAFHWWQAEEYDKATLLFAQCVEAFTQTRELHKAEQQLQHWKQALQDMQPHEEDQQYGLLALHEAILFRHQNQFRVAQEQLRSLESTARQKSWETLLPLIQLNLGICFKALGQSEDAWRCVEQAALNTTPTDEDHIWFECQLLFVQLHRKKGEVQQALAVGLKALQQHLQKDAEESFYTARLSAVLADCFEQQQAFSKALAYNQQAREHFEDLGMQWGLANCENRLGEIHRTLEDHQKAIYHYKRAAQLYQSIDSNSVFYPKLNLAIILLEQRDFSEAHPLLKRLLEQLQQKGLLRLAVYVRAALLSCCAEYEDWETWRHHFAVYQDLKERYPTQDMDLAWLFLLAGEQCEEKQESAEATKSYMVAIEQYQSLQQDEKVKDLQGKIKYLTSE